MAQSGLVASDADDAMLFAICMGFLVVLRHFFLRWYGMVWYGKTIPRKSWVVFIPYHFPRKNGQFSHGEIHPALSTAARCGPTCSSQRAAPSLCRGPSASSSWDPLTSWCVPSWTMTRRLLDLFVGWMKIYLIEFNLYSHSISRIL